MNRHLKEQGMANPWLIVGIIFIVTTLAAAGGMTWALLNYFDQKDNVDTKVSSAVTKAVKTQADKDAADALAEANKLNRDFVGPEDYGALAFSYPKSWSTFVEKDASSTSTGFSAYLNPISVPPLGASQQFALRITIETKDYDAALNTYQPQVKKGDLKSSAVKVNGQDGTRLDGAFTKDIRGSAIIFKIRDKTVTMRTDADTFKGVFDTLIATISFNN